MDKNARMRADINAAAKEMLMGVRVLKRLMDAEAAGSGEMLVDALVEELRKMKSGAAPESEVAVNSGCEMKRYIGTKLVRAEPAWRVTTEDGRKFVHLKSDPSDFGGKIEDGYKVVYSPDGYESWSPKDVFEAAYCRCDGMNFGLAIEAAKMGKKISRRGWNGKGQYVELATNISYRNAGGGAVNADHAAIGSAALAFVGTSGVQLGWLASQADMLADDWYIVE